MEFGQVNSTAAMITEGKTNAILDLLHDTANYLTRDRAHNSKTKDSN